MLSLNISKLITEEYGVFLIGIVDWLHQEVKTWPDNHPQNQDDEQEPPREKNAASPDAANLFWWGGCFLRSPKEEND